MLRKIIRDSIFAPNYVLCKPAMKNAKALKKNIAMRLRIKEKPGDYNHRVQEAISSLQSQPSFAIIEKGLNADELSCIMMWKGKFYGMGYISADFQIREPEALKYLLTPYKKMFYPEPAKWICRKISFKSSSNRKCYSSIEIG